jgi:hypothetical protein
MDAGAITPIVEPEPVHGIKRGPWPPEQISFRILQSFPTHSTTTGIESSYASVPDLSFARQTGFQVARRPRPHPLFSASRNLLRFTRMNYDEYGGKDLAVVNRALSPSYRQTPEHSCECSLWCR